MKFCYIKLVEFSYANGILLPYQYFMMLMEFCYVTQVEFCNNNESLLLMDFH